MKPSRPVEDRLILPQVTLCAATSVNVQATVRALEACLAQVSFADCKLFTDTDIRPDKSEIRVVPISPLTSSEAYSNFLLTELAEHIETSHCLVVQWDGHILDARHWRPEFLEYDYIGASWPQFDDGHDVGNGGFSLRTHRLMKACGERGFTSCHPEDLVYRELDQPQTVWTDFYDIFKSLLRGPQPIWRAGRLVLDRTFQFIRRR
jgi:hypothetical protein